MLFVACSCLNDSAKSDRLYRYTVRITLTKEDWPSDVICMSDNDLTALSHSAYFDDAPATSGRGANLAASSLRSDCTTS